MGAIMKVNYSDHVVTEEQIDRLMPFLQDLVRHESECERVEWVESPFHIRFGSAD